MAGLCGTRQQHRHSNSKRGSSSSTAFESLAEKFDDMLSSCCYHPSFMLDDDGYSCTGYDWRDAMRRRAPIHVVRDTSRSTSTSNMDDHTLSSRGMSSIRLNPYTTTPDGGSPSCGRKCHFEFDLDDKRKTMYYSTYASDNHGKDWELDEFLGQSRSSKKGDAEGMCQGATRHEEIVSQTKDTILLSPSTEEEIEVVAATYRKTLETPANSFCFDDTPR